MYCRVSARRSTSLIHTSDVWPAVYGTTPYRDAQRAHFQLSGRLTRGRYQDLTLQEKQRTMSAAESFGHADHVTLLAFLEKAHCSSPSKAYVASRWRSISRS
jgi:hypothetical protein